MNRALILILVGLAGFVGLNSIFTVTETEYALKFQLGRVLKSDYEPGLHWKIPLLENVSRFDARIQTLDAEPEPYLTSEKKNVLVDSFIKWRIIDPAKYYVSVNGDERQAERRLTQTVNDGLRAEFGKRTIQEVVSGERSEIMDIIKERADRESNNIGIQILDVRLRRVDLPKEVSDSVYQRMEAERKSVANELRSEGFAESEKIKANAEKEKEIIITDAYREAQKLKGEGDAKAARIYSNVFNKNKEFYDFYRSIEAYRNSVNSKDDILVLDPNTEFFKYLQPKKNSTK